MVSNTLSNTLSKLGPAKIRGVCYSCDPLNDLEVAEAVARRVGTAATWYSVGILSKDRDLSLKCAKFCKRFGLLPLFHPIDLDICGTDPLDDEVLQNLSDRADELDVPWINTDLAMWCRGGESLLENLIPMPLIDEAVSWTVDRVKRAQEVLGRPIAIENAPYPFMVGERDILSLMTEIAEQADCLMTIDVGHLYGLRRQRGVPLILPSDKNIAWNRVVEAHMSGSWLGHYPNNITVVDDKHDWEVAPYVWDLAMELLPHATNLRAVMFEAEGLRVEELARSIVCFSQTFQPFRQTPSVAMRVSS